MLGGLGLAFGHIRVAGRVDVDLHHEGELRILLLDFDQAGENFFPSRRSEKVVIDQEQRLDTMMLAGVAQPAHDRVRFARAHRAAHHVHHAKVRAGERASARFVERGHRVVEKSREITIVEHRQQRLGDQRNDNVFLAGLGANSLRDRVADFQLTAQKILDDVAPDIFSLADDGGYAAFVEELARIGEAADMEAAHHRGDSFSDELKREVPTARVLIRLHSREPNQQLDAVFTRLVLNRSDCLGADNAVADFVPNHRLKAYVALDRVALVERLVERRHHGQGIVRLDAVAEILDEAVLVIARRFDEIHPNRAARLRFLRRICHGALTGSQLEGSGRTVAAIAISPQQPIEDTRSKNQESAKKYKE